MRTFSSYGPVDKDIHYYVPRTELVNTARKFLLGKNPEKGGHYITVWASRQCGKSWLLREIYWELKNNDNYFVANIDLQSLKNFNEAVFCANEIISKINMLAKLKLPKVETMLEFQEVFNKNHLSRPLVLILDEFDSLQESVISEIVEIFRNIYNSRTKDTNPSHEKEYLLHGVALIGVRSVVGVENKSGSPFNVQKSLHISNLTEAEVNEMYHWYEKESGKKIEQVVIDRIFYVTQGQPGLVSWFGELITEEANNENIELLTMEHWNEIYLDALHILPNNQILNIISKVKIDPYRKTILQIFQTKDKIEFNFEDTITSYLYMNGVITFEKMKNMRVMKFPCQFIQEKLFGYFSRQLVNNTGDFIIDSFMDLDPIINDDFIDIRKLLGLYQDYFSLNRKYIIEYAQQRIDLQVKEVVFHFQLFAWLNSFLKHYEINVLPEFPTGNGKIDILLRLNNNKLYGLELKSFSTISILKDNIKQASAYGKSLNLEIITLAIFIDKEIPEHIENQYSKPIEIEDSSNVDVVFIMTGKRKIKEK